MTTAITGLPVCTQIRITKAHSIDFFLIAVTDLYVEESGYLIG